MKNKVHGFLCGCFLNDVLLQLLPPFLLRGPFKKKAVFQEVVLMQQDIGLILMKMYYLYEICSNFCESYFYFSHVLKKYFNQSLE